MPFYTHLPRQTKKSKPMCYLSRGIFSPIKGFTLIELMVVMAIVALLMMMVGPLAINSLEKAEAKQEMLSLKNWFRKVSARAFNTGQVHIVHLDGKQISLSVVTNKESTNVNNLSANAHMPIENIIDQFSFESLFFQPQILTYNNKGFVTPLHIQGTYRGNPIDVDLKVWINGESELESVQF